MSAVPIRRDPAGRATVIVKALPKGHTVPETWALVGFVQEGFPTPVREYRAFPPRRFDLAWPDYKIALEIDGGVYTRGRHTRGKGFEADCRKMNEAAASGWTVFRVSTGMLYKEWPEIVRLVRAAFQQRINDRHNLRVDKFLDHFLRAHGEAPNAAAE